LSPGKRYLSLDTSAALDRVFHARSVAVVGASASQAETGWVARLQAFGCKGAVYPVNPRATEIGGLKAYPSVRDIPGEVDYAIFNIPARVVPQAMEDCVQKGVRAVHIFTAGFGETGKDEARELEKRVAAIAAAGGVRVIGPNCMGVYYPAGGLTFNPAFSREAGNVAFVSQTGAGATRFVYLANSRGVRFSKVVSYGNAMDLDETDFLEYLAGDPETEIITGYVEGVRDGRRFMEAVRQCLVTRPVIILKAGLTESGAGAAASHTAALAGSESVWDAFFRQSGAIRVDTLEEITDMVLALQHLRPPRGRRVAIVGRGGGIGVVASDACDRAGLKVPPFRGDTRRQLEEVIPEAGAGARNPVETTLAMSGVADFYTRGLGIVDADPEIDFILTHIAVDVYGGRHPRVREQLAGTADVLADVSATLSKPLAAVLYPGEYPEAYAAVLEARDRLLAAGIPVYGTIEAAARAVSRLIDYCEWRARWN